MLEIARRQYPDIVCGRLHAIGLRRLRRAAGRPEAGSVLGSMLRCPEPGPPGPYPDDARSRDPGYPREAIARLGQVNFGQLAKEDAE